MFSSPIDIAEIVSVLQTERDCLTELRDQIRNNPLAADRVAKLKARIDRIQVTIDQQVELLLEAEGI